MPAPTQASFALVAHDLSPSLLRYFMRRTEDRGTAEDLVQETLLRIQRGLPDFDGRASVKTWALAIARRVASDHFRRSTAQPHLDLDEALGLADPAPAADYLLATSQMSECVREQLDALSPGDREVLLLHDIEEAGITAVAENCGCSGATARVRLHRARKRLKQSLTDNCEFYRETDNVLRCCRKDGEE